MSFEDELLQAAARDGSMDYPEWPALLERILPRLDRIAYNDFPMPTIPPEALPPAPILPTQPDDQQQQQQPDPSSQEDSSQASQATNKENAPPPETQQPTPPPLSTDADANNFQPPDGTLPPALLSLLSSIKTTLTSQFAASPPHTIQRLAELLLHPRTYYRTLPSYLRALDRVVTVSSGADLFPLPNTPLPNGDVNSVLNGASGLSSPPPRGAGSSFTSASLGSDESLGGALLTPIPWLRAASENTQGEVHTESTEMVDGPNGTGSIETVTVSVNGVSSSSSPQSPHHQQQDTSAPSSSSANTTPTATSPPLRSAGAVTQGELLRQEQQAGVVPISTLNSSSSPSNRTRSALAAGGPLLTELNPANTATNTTPATTGTDATPPDDEPEHPHARGPEEVGMADMGPQGPPSTSRGGGFDVEAALGRSVPRGHGGLDGADDAHADEAANEDMSDVTNAPAEAEAEGSQSAEPPTTTTSDTDMPDQSADAADVVGETMHDEHDKTDRAADPPSSGVGIGAAEPEADESDYVVVTDADGKPTDTLTADVAAGITEG
ncbi:MAG: hypothetical protein M1819_000741 [Sarea resinae]|nr:MAG: hypothetical protein M1819_000741 [Sarea resinae]